MNKIDKPEKLIKQLAANTTELLNDHWAEVEALGSNGKELKIGMIHWVVNNAQAELTAKTVISFGRRIKDTVEHQVDDKQTELVLEPPKRKAK
jgi:hypothetical protein